MERQEIHGNKSIRNSSCGKSLLIIRVSWCTLTSCNYLSNFFFFFFWKNRLMISSSWLELNQIPYSTCVHRPEIFPTASQMTYSITYKPITEIMDRRRPDQSLIPFYPTVIFLCSLPHLFKASLDTPAWMMQYIYNLIPKWVKDRRDVLFIYKRTRKVLTQVKWRHHSFLVSSTNLVSVDALCHVLVQPFVGLPRRY